MTFFVRGSDPLRKVFIAGLIIMTLASTGCNKKNNFETIKSDITTEEEIKFEPIGCYRFRDNETGLYGYIDGNGKIIIEPKYKDATDFQYLATDYALAYDENDTVTIIDKTGKEYLPFGEYKLVHLPQAELIVFKDESSKYGVIDLEGEKVLEPIYDKIEINYKGAIIVKLENKYGAFNKDGKAILDVEYDYIIPIEDSLITTKDDKNGLFNLKGEEVIQTIYKEVQIAHTLREYEWETFKVVNNEDKIAFFDNSGKQLTDFLYDEVSPGRDGLIPVRLDNKWGYIDVKGEVGIPFEFDYASSFSDEKAEVEVNGERKFINIKGDFIEEEKINYTLDGKKYFLIEEDNKYKVISEEGKVLIDNNYSSMSLYNDIIIARTEDLDFLLDLKGNTLAECKFLIQVGPNVFVTSQSEEELKGKLIDSKGNILSDYIYVEVFNYEEFSKIVAKKSDGNYVVLNEKGEKLLDIEEGATSVIPFEENLIRVEFNAYNFKWINTKGEELP